MEGLILVVVIGTAILASGIAAVRLRVPPPLVLLVAGSLLGLAPLLSTIALPPALVLMLFLPALLYWESLNTSLREIRSNVAVIAMLAVGLVVVTAVAVTALGRAFGLSWPMARAPRPGSAPGPPQQPQSAAATSARCGGSTAKRATPRAPGVSTATPTTRRRSDWR